jgi:hypothetical protein
MNLVAFANQSNLRKLIIPMVLLLSLATGWLASNLLLFGLAGVIFLLVLLRKPEIGLIGLIPAALVIPFEIGTGSYSGLNAAILLTGLLLGIWFLEMLMRQEIRIFPSIINLPAILFIIGAILSLLVGNLTWNYFASKAPMTAQLGGLAVFLLSIGILLLTANRLPTISWLKWATWIFILMGVLYMISSVLPGLNWINSQVFQKGARGSLFWVWIAVLPAGQALYNTQFSRRQRILVGMVSVLVLGLGIRNRGWASGWLPGSVAVLF